jgi:hypothetical protein
LARIFLVLSLFAVALLGVNIILGLSIGDYHADAREYMATYQRLDELEKSRAPTAEIDQAKTKSREIAESFTAAKGRFVLHFLFGLAAGLVTVLVNSVSVTYFIGTSRWCREVVEAYGLDQDLIARSNSLKRRTFPWALGGIGVMLAIIALGAASDPSRAAQGTANWVLVHYVVALAGTFVIAVSLLMQVVNIAANYSIIDEIVSEVARIRAERGLDVEPEISNRISEISNPQSEIRNPKS